MTSTSSAQMTAQTDSAKTSMLELTISQRIEICGALMDSTIDSQQLDT